MEDTRNPSPQDLQDTKLLTEAENAHVNTNSEDEDPENDRFLSLVASAAGDGDMLTLRKLLMPLHPADVAGVIGRLPEATARSILALVGEEFDSEVFAELDEETRDLAVETLSAGSVAKKLDDLDTDDAVAFVQELDAKDLANVLAAASKETRENIEGALSFDEETAGRLMQREFVAAPEFWNVGRTIDHMRATGEDLPDLFFEIYVVDPAFRPIGAVAVSKLMRAARNTPMTEIMEELVAIIDPQIDQEEVALSFQKYHLISAPVVDEFGRLNGMITVDDIVKVVQEEGQEDMLALANVSESSGSDTVFEGMKSRLPWLLINLVTAFANSAVIKQFDQLIGQFVALAVLMPIGSALGGNAGTQTLAVAVRALATRELNEKNSFNAVWREFGVGVLNGLMVGSILGGITYFWFGSLNIALAAGIALVVNFIAAGLVGILFPLGLKKFGQDPAVASSIFVTWMTDLVGFSAFLFIALVLLK